MSADHCSSPTSTAAIAAGVDHVRLSYRYLDAGDLDAYGSLLADNVRLRRPELPETRGRAASLTALAELNSESGCHEVEHIVTTDDCIVAFGHLTGSRFLEFADYFTLTEDGLLRDCRRYYAVPPPPT